MRHEREEVFAVDVGAIVLVVKDWCGAECALALSVLASSGLWIAISAGLPVTGEDGLREG